MKTIIKIKTYMCELGIGKLGQEGACRFHKPMNELPEDKKCPIHKTDLLLSNLPEDQMTITVISEEELETEEVSDGLDAEGKEKKRLLTTKEKNEKKLNIRADIIKFKKLEN